MSVAQSERSALCDLFGERGPDAPTLCEGWAAADLAAHLVVRERRPVAGLGILVSPLSSLTERAMESEKRRPWPELIERVRGGPPLWWRPIEGLFNTIEYFVHHEDLRRGDSTTGPREGIDAVESVLWGMLGRVGRLGTRAIKGVGVDLVWPEPERVLHARRGEPLVRLVGTPGEIVLYLYGRKSAARVALEGDDEAVARVREADLGI